MSQMTSNGSKTEVYRISGDAFSLIQQHQTPPNPVNYALWYAYASKSHPDVVQRVDELVQKGGEISAYEIDEIYRAYLADGSGGSSEESIGAEIESNLASAAEMLKHGAQNNTAFQETLSSVEGALPESIASGELDGVVAKLVSENRRMLNSTLKLSEGLRESQSQIQRLHQELEHVRHQSLRDPLTEVANRRAFDHRLAAELANAAKNNTGFCLALADIDHFKQVNDTYGHQTGDNVLKAFATIIAENIKGQDLVARYGGEEFAIILPQTSLLDAYNLAVKIKHRLERAETPVEESEQTVSVTASFGISAFKPGMSVAELIERADQHMYQAKNAGRNRVKAEGLD